MIMSQKLVVRGYKETIIANREFVSILVNAMSGQQILNVSPKYLLK